MGDNRRKDNSSISFEQKTASYEVGYCKPPTATRFRKGQSGNPCGLAKGVKNKVPPMNEERMKTILLEEAYRVIKVRDGSREVAIPVIKAVVRSMALTAAKGHARSQLMFTSLLQATENERWARHDEWLKTAIEYKTNWEETLERRKRLGLTGPEPFPHPDDIIIDTFTGEVTIKGPLTKEQKEAQDQLVAMRPIIEKSVRSVNRRLSKNPNDADDIRLLRELRQSMLQVLEVEQIVKRRASKA
jgi:Family of unknown function (DUF5681)